MKIGDTVFVARSNPVEKRIVCPHCFGQKFLTVILGDGSSVSIDCTGCASGFNPPCGMISTHVFTPYTEAHTITGMDSRLEGETLKIMYWSGCGGFNGEDCFSTEQEAQARAQELLIERQKEEDAQLNIRKTNRDRSWAWNATYHRDCLKRAMREVEYHTAKLQACKAHSQSEKQEVAA